MPTTTIADAGPYRLKLVATKTADQLDLQARPAAALHCGIELCRQFSWKGDDA
jgi:hypothetical protein